MNFKKSHFNVVIKELEDGKKLIYNTFTGIFAIMDNKTQALYDEIENTDISLLDDEETLKNLDLMKKSGYIVSVNKDEFLTLKLESAKGKFSGEHLSLTIAPTMDCNMRCPYCYEDKNDKVMSDEIQEKLVEFVKMAFIRNPHIKYFSVYWYGGEPLLQKEIIYNLSQNFLKICEEKDINYYSSIVTNGSFLDAETAKKLKDECKVSSVQITMDGMKELHNTRRILMDGSDSFNIIVNNIEACRDILRIGVRMNIDKENVDEIDALTKYFREEKGWGNNPVVYIAPVTKYNETCGVEQSECFAIEQFAELNNKFLRKAYLTDRESVAQGFFPRRKSIFCGAAGTNSFIVDPEGYLYTCWNIVGIVEKSIGNINEPFIYNSEYAKWMFMDLHEKCEKCQYLPMCQGGCPFYRLSGDGVPKCFHTFYSYKDKLLLAYEDYMFQKSKQEDAASAV